MSGGGARRLAATLLRGTWAAALALLALAALALAVAENAAAQTETTLLSNKGQLLTWRIGRNPNATAFTTGGNTGGYALTSVDLYVSTPLISAMTPRVEIFENSGDHRPGTRHATLTNPATITQGSFNTFNAPANTTLRADTTYWLVVSNDGRADGTGLKIGTADNPTATGAAMGWSIGSAVFKFDTRYASWSTTKYRAVFSVKGTAASGNNAPTAADKTVTIRAGTVYAFNAEDFNYADLNGDRLAGVKIVTLPSAGTLNLGSVAVTVNQVITRADINNGDFSFTPASDSNTSFTFKVNDGALDSAGAYTMSIDVAAAGSAACAAPSFGDRRRIWTGELTVARIEFGGISFGYGFGFSQGSISPSDMFSIGSSNYTIETLRSATGVQLEFKLSSDLTEAHRAALRLHVCDVPYDFKGTSHDIHHTYIWDEVFLDWETVTTRTVHLSLPAANNPATGAPRIRGSARAGQTLRADASGIADADGLSGVDFTYQWYRVDADGSSNEWPIQVLAKAATYTLTANDMGKKFKVKVSFTDNRGNGETRTSAVHPPMRPAGFCVMPDFAGRERIWTGEVTVGAGLIAGTAHYHGFDSTNFLGAPFGALDLPTFNIGRNAYTVVNVLDYLTETTLGLGLNSALTDAEKAALQLHVCDTRYDFSAATTSSGSYSWPDNLDWSSLSSRTLYLSLPEGFPLPAAPGAPSGLSAQSVSGKPGYLRLSWTPASGSGLQPAYTTDYEARYRKTGATNWSPNWSFRNYGTPGFDYPPTTPAAPRGGNDAPLIYYLDPNTEYQVQVRATNSYGQSGWSNQVSATTVQATTANDVGTADDDTESGPAAAPSQPTVRRVANEPGLMVRWNAPRTPSADTHVAYQVEIEKERERDRRITTLRKRYLYVVKSVDDGVTPPPTSLLIPGLEPNTAYTVRVRVVYQIPELVEGLTTVEGIYSAWSPDTSGTTAATGRANNIQLSLEFPDGTRSTTAAPGAEVTYRVKATGIHDWAAVRARGGIGKAEIRIWEPERHKYHFFPYSYYQSTKGILEHNFIKKTGSSGYLEGKFTVADAEGVEAGVGAYGTIEIQLVPRPSRCRGSACTVGRVSSSTNRLCIAVDRSGTVAHPCSSGQTQAEAPTVEGTPGLSASGSDGSWAPGQTVEATVTFSEAVTVDTSSGTPSITLTLGTLEQSASYTRGSGTKALVFAYTLSESDGSHTAMGVSPDSLALNGGSITSEATGADADLGHDGATIMGTSDGGTGPREVPERTGPTASFSEVPATHDGEKPFKVKLSFSAKPRGLSYKTVRDSLLEVTGGTVTGALRVSDGSDREWNVTVKPSQGYAITLTLPPRACSETAAVCVDGRSLSRAASATIPGKALTASLTGPAEHDGSESFTVRLTFSMEPHMSYKTVRDTMFTEKGGAITGARRVKPPHNREFDIVVKPGGDGAVSFSLASPLPACGETGAVCTAPGRKIEGAVSATIPGPAAHLGRGREGARGTGGDPRFRRDPEPDSRPGDDRAVCDQRRHGNRRRRLHAQVRHAHLCRRRAGEDRLGRDPRRPA